MSSSSSSSKIIFILLGLFVLGLLIRLSLQSRSSDETRLLLYSGRSEELIQPLIDQFEAATGVGVDVRYGKTAEMAATLLEEGDRSPADLFLAQDAGALGAVDRAGLLAPLPRTLLDRIPALYRSPQGTWLGLSGRARVLAYRPDRVPADQLPASLQELTQEKWRGRVGWAPQNASFQAFVTSLRVTRGEAATRDWLIRMRNNDTRVYAKNTPILLAVAAGEIDLGLVNHYYHHALQRDRGAAWPVQNHYPDEGALINVAGIGMLRTSTNTDLAELFLAYMTGKEAQTYFTDTTFEYPLTAGVAPNPVLPDLDSIVTIELDLTDLEDLPGTLDLLRELQIL
jgi:iron(III) transport system substrate-binding protein